MINILISVRRPFSGKILDDLKPLELRKTYPNLRRDETATLWLYESGKDGERAIIGKCTLFGHNPFGKQLMTSKLADWVCLNACVTRDHLNQYLPCRVWFVGDPVRLPSAVPLSVIGLTRPPQSWQYLTPEQAATLERRLPW